MKPTSIWLVMLGVTLVSAGGQVAVQQTESQDKSFQRTEIRVETMDRTLVPLTIESRTKQISDTTTRTETEKRVPLADGGSFVAERATTVTEQVDPNTTTSTRTVTDLDRQGKARVGRQVTTTTTKTPTGEQTVEQVHRRDSSGDLVPETRTVTTETRQPDGSSRRTVVAQERDVNDRLVAKREVTATTVKPDANTAVTTSSIKTFNHLRGRFEETAREVTKEQTQGAATTTETVISVPRGAGWEVAARVETTEQPMATGGLAREVVQYGKPLHAQSSPTGVEPLKPRLKIVERYVQKPDGSSTQQREVYFWGVNNEWTKQRFSTAYGEGSGAGY